jgi:predicted dehydrogenase
MKFLIVGLGSMGKRRIRNLQYLKMNDIIGFDLREDRIKEARQKYGIKTFENFDDTLREDPDAFIISTPPDLHTNYAMIAARNNRHFFTEASVVSDGMEELITLCKNKDIIAAPSCTMRFHSSIKKIKEIIESNKIGEPLAFTYHSGQYLPDWHQWEDYRTFYVSRRETGAAREIVPFELVWLTWIFGEIETVSCLKGKLTKLDTSIDDVYQILMKFKNNILGHLMVDVIARVADRSIKIFCEKGEIFWEWGGKIQVYNGENKKWCYHEEEKGTSVEGYEKKIREEPYIEEMKTFIKAIRGEVKYPYTLEDDLNILRVLEKAEKSSEEEIHVKM